MWRKATGFAALVVGSSLALLTGVQADVLNFGLAAGSSPPLIFSNCCTIGFNSAGNPTGQTGTANIANFGAAGFAATRATFGSLSGASPSFGTPVWTSPTTGFTAIQLTGNGSGTYQVTGANVPLPLNFNFAGNTMSGAVTLTSVQDNPSPGNSAGVVTVNGNFTENPGGSGPLFDAFAAGGTFSLPLTFSSGQGANFTLAGVFAGTSGGLWMSIPGATITPNPIAVIPLPPAIYLFGSVLGGAFWLGRRKRSAVSGLSSA